MVWLPFLGDSNGLGPGPGRYYCQPEAELQEYEGPPASVRAAGAPKSSVSDGGGDHDAAGDSESPTQRSDSRATGM
jgi:hypothetical protein